MPRCRAVSAQPASSSRRHWWLRHAVQAHFGASKRLPHGVGNGHRSRDEAADAAGINVLRLRYTAVVISGVLAAMGGAFLSTGQSSLFTRGMSAGRGYIALAALILAKWKPVPVLFACLFFGFTEAVTIQIQGMTWGGEPIPVQFIEMIPYVATIIVLAGFIGLSRAPKALGKPYSKES